MSALAKIKKAAAQHEQDRHYDKALAQYARLLDGGAGADEEVDVTLYNRAGDLALRAGDLSRAIAYFERAIDLYAAGGFLNNAIALAVKILRHAPGHLAAHHTLGVLYGRKGFRAEARQHLAAYAAQMHFAGRADEVGRTLSELAALGTTPDEITSARELLTARAATPDDAGALVKAFDAALGPVDVRADEAPTSGERAGATAIPLSELIEFEIRGPRFAATAPDALATPTVRWTSALPGDAPPLRLSALTAPAASGDFELLDLGAPPPTIEGTATSDHDAEHGVAADAAAYAFEAVAFDGDTLDGDTLDGDTLGGDTIEAAPFEAVSFETAGFEVAEFEAPTADAPTFELSRFEIPVFDVPDADRTSSDLDALDLAPADVATPEPVPSAAAPIEPAELTDLGEWLRATDVPSSTRLVTPAPRETGDEDADFGAALSAFTTGIAQSVDAGDRESHYDLGVAFREMGLLTDAVREFQRALAAPGAGLREREALAHCFLELGRPELALATLEHVAAAALAAGEASETLIGVHYVLAEAARQVGRDADARTWYVRVLASDYTFRDAATRLAALPPPSTPAPPR